MVAVVPSASTGRLLELIAAISCATVFSTAYKAIKICRGHIRRHHLKNLLKYDVLEGLPCWWLYHLIASKAVYILFIYFMNFNLQTYMTHTFPPSFQGFAFSEILFHCRGFHPCGFRMIEITVNAKFTETFNIYKQASFYLSFTSLQCLKYSETHFSCFVEF